MTGRIRRPAAGLGAILLGVVLLQPLAALARGNALQEAIAAFEQRGFVIRREHPRCAEPQLFGLYVRGRREVVVCPRGNQLETLLHEGWHAVQSLCLRGTPLLGSDALLHQLGRRDRRELQLLYRPDQWPREAEARLMAREPLDRYLQTLDRACTAAVPAPPKAN
ncbi:hypothetical protein [Cyanobium sp. FACHB-13342]|uniref:hypothetical protein n=1 Tax=Cyanobium sp. FACHB-13342 TaxID=2692793 RepID=UPI001680A1C8|nr:hypothetical protein [Cyanobium sp. FACHB-13342]